MATELSTTNGCFDWNFVPLPLGLPPDLNPVDYRIWKVMQEHVYQKPMRDVDELMQHVIETR